VTINSTPSYTAGKRFGKHVHDNVDLYLAGAAGLAVGYFLFKGKKAPKLDEAKIVADWMEKQVKAGFNIYALNRRQHELWQTMYEYMELDAKLNEIPMEQMLKEIANVYRSRIGYLNTISSAKLKSA
jgi:hypothetical protein